MSVAEIVVAAPVADVTVFEDRARVVRRAMIELPAGQSRLIVDGVAPVLVDKSLAAALGGAHVLDIRCERRLIDGADDADGARAREVAALEAAQREAAAAVEAGAAAHAAAARDAEAIAALRRAALRELADDAAWGRAPAPGDELARLDAREADATARAAERAAALARLRRDAAALDARLAAARAAAGRDAARLVIDVRADEPTTAESSIEYLVPGACWRPYHTARLDRAARTVALSTDACVWQATGEDWRDARLVFSTERPSLGASPPELVDDVLRVQRKSDVIVADVRDQEIDQVGLGADGAARAEAPGVPGVDDGGVAQRLEPTHPATVIADGRPHRVPLGGFGGAAELARVAMPERSPCVFLRARLANAGARPLLAGPVDLIVDGGYAGRTSILYVAAGERFGLGFGPDPELRVHREVSRERDEAGVLGGKTLTTVRVAVRVSNLGAEPRAVEVTERVPVSEIEQVEVSVAGADAWRPEPRAGGEVVPLAPRGKPDKDGMVTWTVELPAYGRGLCALAYELRADRRVVGI